MVKPLILREHKGRKILLENEPISIANARVGEKPFDEVWTHKRYLKEATDSKRHGRRKGRATYILLDEPIEFEGLRYNIKNIKGSGADFSDEELLIDPRYGPEERGRIHRHKGSTLTRIWGAVTQPEAEEEMETYRFLKRYLTFSPIVGLNIIPKELIENLDLEGEEPLAQLVRLSNTTIRLSDLWRREIEDVDIDPEIAARALIEFIELERELLKNSHCVKYIGEVLDNMYVDGTYTDAENFAFERLTDREQTGRAIKQLRTVHDELCKVYAENEEFDKFYRMIDKRYNTTLHQRFLEWEDDGSFEAQIDNSFGAILRD
jgi:hypothetical protein